jgi:subtilisin family serine protease
MLNAAVDYAINNGVIFVAVAHNFGEAGMGYPGALPQVISVAASGWVGQLPADDPTLYQWILRDVPEGQASVHFIAPFSGRELPGQDLDLAAPGMAIATALTPNGVVDYGFAGGTSLACPHVAGVAALMLQKNPNLTQAQIESILESTAMPLPPACRDSRRFSAFEHGWHQPTLGNNFANATVLPITACWQDNATGAGLLQADAALAATPLP